MLRIATGHSDLDGNVLRQFIGGQMEVRREYRADAKSVGYIRRGEIAEVIEGEGVIQIVFAWMAQDTGLPETPSGQWQSVPKFCEATIDLCTSEPFAAGDNCLGVACRTTHETCIFYPKGHVNSSNKPTALDRRDVMGLE